MASQNLDNIGLDNWLLYVGSKPLHKPILTYH